MESDALLLAAALGFAVVNGLNDGGALVGVGLKVPGLPPAVAAGMLAIALVVAPLVLGTQVASTLVDRLVTFSEPGGADSGRAAVLIAVGTAVTLVAILSRRGLPTSLTLALVGGLAGAGFGSGLPVSYTTLGLVLAAGVAAPVVGGVVGLVLSRLAGRLPSRRRVAPRIRVAHVGAFSLQCLAYAANDGQKMIAIFAVASGTAGQVSPSVIDLVLLATLFTFGLVGGLRPAASALSAEIIPARPPDAVAAELSSAGAVFASSAVGAPVSMTQSVAAALVGAGISHGPRRVRWRAAGRLGLAWVFTLPASALVAAALARGGSLLW